METSDSSYKQTVPIMISKMKGLRYMYREYNKIVSRRKTHNLKKMGYFAKETTLHRRLNDTENYSYTSP